MAKPPSPHIRLTISVSPEVHATFTRMADASGMSLGRCMGEWLADTVEGAEFLAHQLERAREAPRTVVRQMRQEALGLADALGDTITDLRKGAVAGRASGAPHAPAPPRSVIRGGKSPGKTRSGPRAEGSAGDHDA